MSAWVNRRALQAMTNWSARTIRRKVRSGELMTRGAVRDLQYLLDSQQTALTLIGTQGELAGKPVHITPEQKAVANKRYLLVAPIIEFFEGRLPQFSNVRQVAEWVASQNAVSATTVLRYYYDKYLPSGKNIDALARQPRRDRGVLRAFERRPELQKFVMAKWLETDNTAYIKELVERAWGSPLLPYKKDSRAPGYAAIHAFIESIPKSVRDCATLPKQKWEAKHAPYIVTGRGQLTEPNQVWVADHRLYDVLLMNDHFSYAPPHAALRLWETCIQDMRTRVIVGSVWNVTPSWRTIASALRQGISRFGKPALFYCDNGKDFRKIGDGAERGTLLQFDEDGRVPCYSETQGLLARLGIKVSYCTPRHPQAKQIESYFSFAAKRFDRLFFKRGYTGAKPEQRSDFCAEAEKQHKEFLAGKRRESPLMGAEQFVRIHPQWVKEYNETHRHSGRGMDGRTPLEVMNELLPVSQRQIPDMLALAPFFWDVQKRKVSNCKIQLNNSSYSTTLDDGAGLANMYTANETIVAVHCDPDDLAQAFAYEDAPNGKLLARLVSDELAAQGPITAEHVQAVTRERAKLRKASTRALAALTYGVPSEIDLLSERATGTDDARPARNFSRALPPARARFADAFVSDSVARSRGFFDDVILESEEKE